MLLPWDYIYIASRGAQIENYIVENFKCLWLQNDYVCHFYKKMHLRGGRGCDPCLLTKQVWEGRFSKDNFCQIKKKKNNDKNNIKMWRTVLRSYLSTDLLFY